MLIDLLKRRRLVALLACCTSVVGCAMAQDQGPDQGEMAKQAPPKANAQMQKVLDHHAKLNPKPIETLSQQEARKQPSPADAVTALKKEMGMPTGPLPGVKSEDRSIGDGDQKIPVRIYTPDGAGDNANLPVVVYYHGGGFVIATIDTYDASSRSLSKQLNAVVVSVEYRKAPENPFPASHEDSYAALQWVANHAAELKGDPSKIAVAGESAGGNLANAVCLMARDRGGKMPVAQVLVYPVVDNDTNTESYKENANAKPLNRATMKWFFTKEGQATQPQMKPYLLPLKNADVKGLPPTTIILAQIDPLRSEGEAYAAKLKTAGIDTEVKLYEGVTHEFFGMADVVDEAKDAQALAVSRLKKAFTK